MLFIVIFLALVGFVGFKGKQSYRDISCQFKAFMKKDVDEMVFLTAEQMTLNVKGIKQIRPGTARLGRKCGQAVFFSLSLHKSPLLPIIAEFSSFPNS